MEPGRLPGCRNLRLRTGARLRLAQIALSRSLMTRHRNRLKRTAILLTDPRPDSKGDPQMTSRSFWRRATIAGCGILCLLTVRAGAQVDRATVSHGPEAAAEIKAAAAQPTPRASAGHPDLTGYWDYPQPGVNEHTQRSEERRVGKECRSRWSPYH